VIGSRPARPRPGGEFSTSPLSELVDSSQKGRSLPQIAAAKSAGGERGWASPGRPVIAERRPRRTTIMRAVAICAGVDAGGPHPFLSYAKRRRPACSVWVCWASQPASQEAHTCLEQSSCPRRPSTTSLGVQRRPPRLFALSGHGGRPGDSRTTTGGAGYSRHAHETHPYARFPPATAT
jgi:hypothetical protein